MNNFRKEIFRLKAGRGIGNRVLILAALLIIPASISASVNSAAGEQPAVQYASSSEPSCTMSVTYNEGLFTVTAAQCHLRALLSEMGLKGGIKFEVDASLQESLITVSFVGKKLEDAIGAILDIAGQKNIAVEYEKTAEKGSEFKAKRVFLARRETEGSGSQAGMAMQSEQSQDNIIHYSNYRLTVKVTNMDVMELLAAFEMAVNVPGERNYRIIVNDPIIGKISMDMVDSQEQDVLDNIVNRLRPKAYSGKLYTTYLIPEGSGKKEITAYIIRRMSQEEVAERDRKIREYLETAKRLIEVGAYREAQNALGGLYNIDRFNADGAFYTGLNALRQGAPAAGFFKRVLDLDPGYVDAYYWHGVASEKENIGAAAKSYREYIVSGKDEKLLAKARNNLAALEQAVANLYFQNLWRARNYSEEKDLPAADSIYQDLINSDPGRPEAYWSLTVNYVRQRKIDAAYDMLQKADELPERDTLLCFVGEAYLGQKEYAKARHVFENLLRNKQGKDLRDRIERAMKDLK